MYHKLGHCKIVLLPLSKKLLMLLQQFGFTVIIKLSIKQLITVYNYCFIWVFCPCISRPTDFQY